MKAPKASLKATGSALLKILKTTGIILLWGLNGVVIVLVALLSLLVFLPLSP